jgi:Rps23 Pro-64 3,4-dihydroxylase Tpa1-like proline 4-hydroxylase
VAVRLLPNRFFARRFTFGEIYPTVPLLFLYQEPKFFQGGDLLLCDTLITSRAPITGEYEYQVENFTRIIPTNNCLVVFPSAYVHAATPVQLEAQDFQQGRLAISGHVHKAFEPTL